MIFNSFLHEVLGFMDVCEEAAEKNIYTRGWGTTGDSRKLRNEEHHHLYAALYIFSLVGR